MMRRFLLLVLALLLVSAHDAQAQPKIRCMVTGGSFAALRQRSTPGPLVPGLDAFIAQEAVALGQVFRVIPEFAYLPGDDPDSDNAYASPDHDDRLAHGSVFFGRQLLSGVLQDEQRSYASIAGILAHEFAHIAQFRQSPALEELEAELQADYLAGYYLARRAHTLPQSPEQFVFTLFGYGDRDFEFYHPVGHGTGDQRVAAMLAGLNDRDPSFANAYRNGLERIRQLIPAFIDRESGYGELSPAAHDPEAFARLQPVGHTTNWNLNPVNPFAEFRYRYINNGSAPMLVKLIVSSQVVPVDAQGEPGDPRPLTQRRIQRLVQPGQTVEFRDRIRSTSQSESVRVRIAEDVVVAYAAKVNPNGSPVTPPPAARSADTAGAPQP